jgi:glycerol-3-phosphate cytidylyltransferase
MRYCFDLDETLCATPSTRIYADAVPYLKMIEHLNALHDSGHHITIYTARGSTSGINYNELTVSQLSSWGVKYDLLIDKGKPSYDVFVDDKAHNSAVWRKSNNIVITGFVASSFDLLHAGHCMYLKDARSVCDHLVAGLQVDPTIDRPSKNRPIQSLEERLIQLRSVKYVDQIEIYTTESDLEQLLSKIKPDIRILGSDAKGKPITGYKYCDRIYYHERNHTYSSSELRQRLVEVNERFP